MNIRTESERVREEIAQVRCLHCDEYSHHKQSCLITPNINRFCPEALSYADQILSIDGIEIRAKDQSLPSVRNAVNKSYNDYMLGQEDMLKPDSEGRVWVKVEPKGGKK